MESYDLSHLTYALCDTVLVWASRCCMSEVLHGQDVSLALFDGHVRDMFELKRVYVGVAVAVSFAVGC